jgi:hypothetical protein
MRHRRSFELEDRDRQIGKCLGRKSGSCGWSSEVTVQVRATWSRVLGAGWW